MFSSLDAPSQWVQLVFACWSRTLQPVTLVERLTVLLAGPGAFSAWTVSLLVMRAVPCLPFQSGFPSFLCLIHWLTSPSRRIGVVRANFPALCRILTRKPSVFYLRYDVSCMFFVCALNQVKEVCFWFVEGFQCKLCWILSSVFSASLKMIGFFPAYSFDVVKYSAWVLNPEGLLHCQDSSPWSSWSTLFCILGFTPENTKGTRPPNTVWLLDWVPGQKQGVSGKASEIQINSVI